MPDRVRKSLDAEYAAIERRSGRKAGHFMHAVNRAANPIKAERDIDGLSHTVQRKLAVQYARAYRLLLFNAYC